MHLLPTLSFRACLRVSRIGIAFLLSLTASAQSLLLDVQPARISSAQSGAPTEILEVGGMAYFVPGSAAFGEELWVTDGTPAGTRLVSDIEPGSGGSRPRDLTVLDDRVVFTVQGTTPGRRLYVSDGTSVGTRQLRDFPVGGDAAVVSPTSFQGEVYFGTAGAAGDALWKTDGTVAGTVAVPGVGGTAFRAPRSLCVSGGTLFFLAGSGGSDVDVWATDGTAMGLRRVVDLPSGARPTDPVPFRGGVIFSYTDPATGFEPAFWDGQALVDLEVVPGAVGSGPRDFVALSGGTAVFTASTAAMGRELWRTDGTLSGTVLLADIRAGVADSNIRSLTVVGGDLIFSADDGSAGAELWLTDGTTSGTRRVVDLFPGNAGADPESLVAVGGEVWFSASDGAAVRELFASDGTAAGTRLLIDAYGSSPSDPRFLTAFRDGALGGAGHPAAGVELHFFGGSPTQARLLVDSLSSNEGSRPDLFTPIADKVFFVAENDTWGREPHTAGGPGSARLAVNVWPGRRSGNTVSAAGLGDTAYFNGDDGQGDRLWQTDGTFTGTGAVTPAGSAPACPRQLTALGDLVVFVGEDAAAGREPWVTDGTAAGTALLADVRTGVDGSEVRGFTVVAGAAYFVADDGVAGAELWVTDGRTTGTRRVADLAPGIVGSDPQGLVAGLGGVFFAADDQSNGRELWSAGSGAPVLFDVVPGPGSSDPGWITEGGGRVWFTAWTSAAGREWWTTDGTSSGTALLADLVPGGADLVVLDAVGTSAGLFFVADTADGAGGEVWFSDGSASGTLRLKDIFVGAPSGPVPGTLTAVLGNSAMVFVAEDGEASLQLWYSAGTPGTTVPLTRVGSGGLGATSIHALTAIRRSVYFAMDDRTVGTEPFMLDLARTIGADGFAAPFGQGCSGVGEVPVIGAVERPLLGNAGFEVSVTAGGGPWMAYLFLSPGETVRSYTVECRQFLSEPVFTMGMAAPTGSRASLGVPIPATGTLLGRDAFLQWGVVRPGGAFRNMFDLSDGLHVRVGS